MIQFGLSTSVFGAQAPGTREWETATSRGFREIELVASASIMGADKRHALMAVHESAVQSGVQIISLSTALADAPAAVGAATELKCGALIVRAGSCRIHGGDARGPVPDAHTLRRALEPVAEQAEHAGISIAVEFPSGWPAEAIVDLLESMESSVVGVCLDLGHAHLNEGAAETIEQLAGYTRTIHVHDNLGRTDEHRLPFAGAIDWAAVLMELEKTGYTGTMTIELPAETNPATVLDRAVGVRTRLQAILDDLAQPMVFPE